MKRTTPTRCKAWPVLVIFALAGLASLQPAAVAEDRGGRLNVLFISVDDLNVHLGCYGAPVRTPNVDRLAAMGRRFDRAYCQYPLCNPSRTSMMSGWRPEHTQVWSNNEAPRPHLRGASLMQEHFHAQGYYTARVGKIYHGSYENQFRWDNMPGGGAASAPADDAAPAEGRRGGRKEARPGANVVPISWRAGPRPDVEEPDGRTAQRVVQLLEQNKNRPFFLAAGFAKPHLPWVAPKKYFDLYPPESIQLPAIGAGELNRLLPMARVPVAEKDPKSDQEVRQAIAAYHACVSFMDAQVGVLLEAMDRLKLWDKTVIVFYGDNGFHLGEHGLWRKVTLFEESCRVPLIMVAPNMKQAGKPTVKLAELIDVYPTLIDLCGLPKVKGLQATSLVPLLDDPERAVSEAAFSVVAREENRLGKSVRTEQYRYTEWPDGTAELYDEKADPHEAKNLINEAAHAQTVGKLKNLLRAGYKAALAD